jgi:hypothetical protein
MSGIKVYMAVKPPDKNNANGEYVQYKPII